MQFASENLFVRPLKRVLGALLLLALGIHTVPAFSLLGPVNEAYQEPTIGYNLPGDIGAPKNITEEYRYNTPVLYYAFDQTFIDYFGITGMAQIESAIAMMNALTNSGFSALNPADYPLEGTRINPRAEQLFLFDLKTVTLNVLLEELGLAEPARFVWTLRDRDTQPGLQCPFMIYHVIMRNFDPFTYNPSAYVNGVLYTYTILESCTGPNPLAYTFNFPVDPLDPAYTAIADAGTVFTYGSFVLSLTQDDIGGLRYLYNTNNVNWEPISAGSEQFVTNRRQAQLVFSSNLWTFAQAALTNDAAGLTALYPGLIITDTTNIFTNVFVTNVTAYFTNVGPWTPVDSFPILVFQTNRTLTVQTHYRHTFANAFTMVETDAGFRLSPLTNIPLEGDRIRVFLETIAITNAPWTPFPGGGTNATNATITFVTNHTLKPIIRPGFAGDFFLLPTNACSLDVLGLQATLIRRVTNSLVGTTNLFGDIPGLTNLLPQFTQNLVTVESNRVWLVYPVECVRTNETLIRGIDRIQFIRTSFDSLIGRFYQPITNIYTLVEVTNSVLVTNIIRRVVNRPDILFSSQDLERTALVRSEPNWTTNGILGGLAGPGTIDPPFRISFNRVGPSLINVYGGTNVLDGALSQAFANTNFMWGSYDGSTNEPVVYPFGTVLRDVEEILLFQITTFQLPDATVGVPYPAQLTAAGGQPPYSWEPHIDSAPLPAGLTLSSTGIISGIPEEEGEFTFSITVTESGGRSTTRTLTLNVIP